MLLQILHLMPNIAFIIILLTRRKSIKKRHAVANNN